MTLGANFNDRNFPEFRELRTKNRYHEFDRL